MPTRDWDRSSKRWSTAVTYWVPFSRLAEVRIEPPTDLRDIVWLPAQLHFLNGGEVHCDAADALPRLGT
jgi:protein involved in temperature-dependent protein secretion